MGLSILVRSVMMASKYLFYLVFLTKTYWYVIEPMGNQGQNVTPSVRNATFAEMVLLILEKSVTPAS